MIARVSAFAAAALAAIVIAVSAHATESAERFVEINANYVLEVLNDKSKGIDQKKAEFRALIDKITDVDKISRFVLGRYQKRATPAELAEFTEVFKKYAISFYEERLTDYGGETISVNGSTKISSGDVIVHSEISGGAQSTPLEVNWRIQGDAGAHKVVDVEIYGVWLAINQRDEVLTIIKREGGGVPTATRALRAKQAEREPAGG